MDELIDALGRAQIEAVLRLSAEGVAGPSHPGRKGGAIGWHGRERGTVCLRDRRLRVERPMGSPDSSLEPLPACHNLSFLS